jgi:hypothetical protein
VSYRSNIIHRLPNDNTPATSSQVQSWKSRGSQYTREEKIIRNAKVLSLKQINALHSAAGVGLTVYESQFFLTYVITQETTRVTHVGKKIVTSRTGRSKRGRTRISDGNLKC